MKANEDHQKLKDSLEKLIQAQKSLEEAVSLPIVHDRDLAGIIQCFEFVYELSWKTMKRLLEAQGHETTTARDVFKTAYQFGFIQDETTWLDIIEDRNKTSHTYSRAMAQSLVTKIKSHYVKAFQSIVEVLQEKSKH